MTTFEHILDESLENRLTPDATEPLMVAHFSREANWEDSTS
jgi:hypothetical protein